MDKSRVKDALRELIDNESNQFRATNFKKALRAMEEYDQPIRSIDDLRKVPSIGATIIDRLKEHMGEGGYRKKGGSRQTMEYEDGDEGRERQGSRGKRKSESEGEGINMRVMECLEQLIREESNRFKALNYTKALRAIEDYDDVLESLDDLRDVPNIGATIVDRLKEYMGEEYGQSAGYRKGGQGGRSTFQGHRGKRRSVSEGEGINQRVMECLEQLIQDEPNRFKALNYTKALRAIEDYDDVLESLDDLRYVPNIGATIVDRLKEYMGEEQKPRSYRRGSETEESGEHSLNKKIMDALNEVIQNEPNQNRANNFMKALHALESYHEPIRSEKDLRRVPGIGPTVVSHIQEALAEGVL